MKSPLSDFCYISLMGMQLATLKFLFRCGITDLLGDSPVNRMIASVPDSKKKAKENTSIQAAILSPIISEDIDFSDAVTLSALFSKVEALDLPLQRTARSALFYEGLPASKIIFVTAVPSLDDDRDGRLISGKSGTLWDSMLKAISLDRNKVYTMTVSPFRPPAGRRLTKDEAVFFTALFKKHLSFLKPKMVIGLGDRAESFLKTIDVLPATVFSMPHPEDILKDAALKPKAWETLKKIRENLNDGDSNT